MCHSSIKVSSSSNNWFLSLVPFMFLKISINSFPPNTPKETSRNNLISTLLQFVGCYRKICFSSSDDPVHANAIENETFHKAVAISQWSQTLCTDFPLLSYTTPLNHNTMPFPQAIHDVNLSYWSHPSKECYSHGPFIPSYFLPRKWVVSWGIRTLLKDQMLNLFLLDVAWRSLSSPCLLLHFLFLS